MTTRMGIAWIVLLSTMAAAQGRPERAFADGRLVSNADPHITFVLGSAFHYAGAQVRDIANIASAEQHFFADAGLDSVVGRFYLIQFEHYYPNNQNVYDLAGVASLQPVTIGGTEFLGDVRLRRLNPTAGSRARPEPDDVEAFLRSKGYTLDGTFVRARLFYRTDASQCKVLMVIYGEGLAAGQSEDAGRSTILEHVTETLDFRIEP